MSHTKRVLQQVILANGNKCVIGPANMASSNLIEHKGAAMTRRILTQTI